jgi:hypothetical protein
VLKEGMEKLMKRDWLGWKDWFVQT